MVILKFALCNQLIEGQLNCKVMNWVENYIFGLIMGCIYVAKTLSAAYYENIGSFSFCNMYL